MATNPDFTIVDVLAWARTKPADEEYNFLNPNNCAAAQFGRDTGREYLVNVGNLDAYSKPLRMAVMGDCAENGRTFGALVTSLEALVPETPKSDWSRLDAYLTDIETVPA